MTFDPANFNECPNCKSMNLEYNETLDSVTVTSRLKEKMQVVNEQLGHYEEIRHSNYGELIEQHLTCLDCYWTKDYENMGDLEN